MRLRDWLLHHHRQVVFTRCHWMGVRALKNPLDAWIYQEIIHEVQPEVIVELGSLHGGGTLFLANMLDLLGGDRKVVTVDLDHSNFEVQHERIVTVTGNTQSPRVISEVASLCKGKRTMIIHDADHHEQGVLRDLRTYSGLVSPGSYFIVEDGFEDILRRRPLVRGPLGATAQFISETSDFEVDADRERYLLTYNPGGYLRRRR